MMSLEGSKTVYIKYFALLRDERGLASENISTEAATLAELYNEIRSRHDFSLPVERMSVAVNDDFAEWHNRVNDKDVIVFVPPVAGG
ncbi:MoaD/ThiS family protein [Candidatus Obscuribacterales bacterium]|nr:MoaD/ThiS family protein [Candidatus Obscuribacterales bacterium]